MDALQYRRTEDHIFASRLPQTPLSPRCCPRIPNANALASCLLRCYELSVEPFLADNALVSTVLLHQGTLAGQRSAICPMAEP